MQTHETTIEEVFTTNISPYQFAKKVSKFVGKELPPQMFYNYISKGWIHAETNELGKKFVTPSEQVRWVTKYTAPKVVEETQE